MKLWRTLLGLTVILVIGMGCKRTAEEEATLDQFKEGKAIKEAFNVKFTFSENAIVQAELSAPHAIETKENDQDVRIFDRGLHLIFYTPEGAKESDLQAKNGKFRNQFNEAEVWGEVRMVNSKGDRLNTEHLWWNKIKNRIHTDKNRVDIITATEHIRGDSLDANTDFTEYKIFNINGSVDVKEGQL